VVEIYLSFCPNVYHVQFHSLLYDYWNIIHCIQEHLLAVKKCIYCPCKEKKKNGHFQYVELEQFISANNMTSQSATLVAFVSTTEKGMSRFKIEAQLCGMY